MMQCKIKHEQFFFKLTIGSSFANLCHLGGVLGENCQHFPSLYCIYIMLA